MQLSNNFPEFHTMYVCYLRVHFPSVPLQVREISRLHSHNISCECQVGLCHRYPLESSHHLFHCMNANYASFGSCQFFVIWIIQIVLACCFHWQSCNVFHPPPISMWHVYPLTVMWHVHPLTVMWHVHPLTVMWLVPPSDSHVTCSTSWQWCDMFHPLIVMWRVPPPDSHVTCSTPWWSCDMFHPLAVMWHVPPPDGHVTCSTPPPRQWVPQPETLVLAMLEVVWQGWTWLNVLMCQMSVIDLSVFLLLVLYVYQFPRSRVTAY